MWKTSMTEMLGLVKCVVAALLVCNSPLTLAHWPGQPSHQFADLGEFEFERGGKIANLRLSYVTHGKLNAAKDNVILFQHGFALNHHQADHLIGPGQSLDTDKYFIICTDIIGATQTTFEHSISATTSGLKMKFPFYNERDHIRAVYKLITQELQIPHLLAVTGISRGADMTVQWAVSYPDFMDGIFPISGGALWSSQGFFVFSLMFSLIESCPEWNEGQYDDNPKQCASRALSVLVPYFYTRDWWDQYVDTPEAYTHWRNQWGAYYLDIQDLRDFYYRAMAVVFSRVGDTPGFDGDLMEALRSIKAKTLFLYSPQDQFMAPKHIEMQVNAIPDARATAIDSNAGHLICCHADPQATSEMGKVIRAFLEELSQEE